MAESDICEHVTVNSSEISVLSGHRPDTARLHIAKFAISLYVAVVSNTENRTANSVGHDLVHRLHVKAFFTFIMSYEFTVKVKVNFTLEQATKAQRGSRGVPPLFL
jgi:hypothetical protein